jgi:hypothetical protein
MIAIPTVWFVLGYPGGLIALFDRLPGLASGESRLDLATSAGKLIEDYPFTGGGLRSFPGLFSQYIMVTPYFLFAYSHNFYLDIILEQGFLGGLALLVLILGSAIILARQILVDREDHQLKILGEAVFIGLIVILVHGLVDDALYGTGRRYCRTTRECNQDSEGFCEHAKWIVLWGCNLRHHCDHIFYISETIISQLVCEYWCSGNVTMGAGRLAIR